MATTVRVSSLHEASAADAAVLEVAAQAPIALNVGGPAASVGGVSYLADQYFTGGSVFQVAAAIAGTTHDVVHQTERYGSNFGYALPVANGAYEVKLQFAELYYNAAGKRVFDVLAEGGVVVDNLDIWAATGGDFIAKEVTVPVTVSDGVLNLQFVGSVDNAKVDAIQITPVAAPPAGLTIIQSGGATAVTEGGATDTLAVSLSRQPAANVTVTVIGEGDVGGAPASLTFTPANWSQAQTVTLTAVNDALVEGTENAQIGFATSSADAGFHNLAVAPVSLVVTDNDGGAPTSLALNAGGPAASVGGVSYLADQYFTGGSVFQVNAAIAGTTHDAVHQNERTGSNFSYAIPVANGAYSVKLQFAELYYNAAGKRVFDVLAEGKVVVDDLDIWAATGGDFIAKEVTVPVAVSDGVLNLQFVSSVDNAKVDAIQITPVTGGAAAGRLTATPGGAINASTYTAGSFVVENLSTGGQQLTTVVIDLKDALVAGMVFDPAGLAGDAVPKAFTVDSKTGVFTVASASFGEGSNAAGYKTLTLQLQGFDPGDVLRFSVDVDPASIQGVAAPGPGETGSVAGVELTGAEVYFGFGGLTLSNELFKEAGSAGGATVLARAGLPGAPGVAVVGVGGSTGVATAAQQTVNVTGPAGGVVQVLVIEGGAFVEGVPAAAPDLGPYQVNTALKVATYDVVLNAQGRGQVVVTLSDSAAQGGLNLITAATVGPGGALGPASAPITLSLNASSLASKSATATPASVVEDGVWAADGAWAGDLPVLADLQLTSLGSGWIFAA